jgi:protein tyrosine phosphatase (PTP) superfamily phosphohydrolase (DUF442 family)
MHNFHKVNDLLYRSAAPEPKDLLHLKRLGIKKIVSLDDSAGKKIDRAAKMLGIEHIMVPIDIGRKGSILKFLCKDLFDLLQDRGPVLIHCIHGKDRTSLVVAMFRCRYENWSCDDALKEAHKFGFGIGLDPKIVGMYKRLVHNSCSKHDHEPTHDVKSDDSAADDNGLMQYQSIVQNQRDYPSDYRDYSSDLWSQMSWSPYADYRVREFPYANVDINYPSQYDTNITHGLDDSEALMNGSPRTVPQVGSWDTSTDGICGGGPAAMRSGFI